MDTLHRILGYCLIAISIVVLLHAVRAMRRYNRALKLVSLPLFCISILCFDSGTGYIGRGDSSPRTVVLTVTDDASGLLILLFHGYNGSGQSLVTILGPQLAAHGTVVGFEPSIKGYDSEAVLDAAQHVIKAHRPGSIVLYGESLGGMQVMELLRRDPLLHAQNIVFNATPSTVENVKLGGRALEALNLPVLLHGGLLSTVLLRANLEKDLSKAPSPEVGVDEIARQKAYDAMRRVTGRVAFDELRFIANLQPPTVGEFAGRAGSVSYLHAPSTSDTTIETRASSEEIEKAFPSANYTDVSIPEWAPDLHCPTPERPTPLIEKLLTVSQR